MTSKTVLITGAGSGLGRELARLFCSRGYFVAGVGRTESKLVETFGSVDKDSYKIYAADISSVNDAKFFIQDLLSLRGKIDIVFNNAAIYPKLNFLEESIEEFESAFATNVIAAANIAKEVLPSMVKNSFGRMFFVGSWADISPIADSTVYSATKGSLHSLVKGISVDITKPELDLEIHEWIPGHLNTQMSGHTGLDPAIAAEWGFTHSQKTHGDKKARIFEGPNEWTPPKGIKQKILDKLLFRK